MNDTTEPIDELAERLERANDELMDLARGQSDQLGLQYSRLSGKAEGVRLALSYIRDMKELFE